MSSCGLAAKVSSLRGGALRKVPARFHVNCRQILPEMTPERADRLQTLLWIALALAAMALLLALAPILSPFLLAAIVAYICAPLVDRLESLGLPRLIGVVMTILLLAGVAAALVLILLPLLQQEAQELGARLPEALRALDLQLVPWLRERFGIHLRLDPAALSQLLADHSDGAQAVAGKLLDSLRIGGTLLFALIANLLLTPVVLFYLLRDWHPLLASLEQAIPRPWYARTATMLAEVDRVLAEFLRGQFLVMLALAAYYSLGLWLAAIPFALPLGILTGLLVFIPYLGYAIGLSLALVVALLQFAGMGPVLGVALVYGVGQVLEGVVLTPWLVGKRIGLHPLAVIFALLAFAQLFGLFGVLLALPASAALLVALRQLRALYLTSRFYRGTESGATE